MDPDPNEERSSGRPGAAAGTDAPADPRAGAPAAARSRDVDAPDEADLDSRWGFAPSQPVVGYGTPPVVAVVVTADPGEWFADTLKSLGDQDYENLSVLVIDNGSERDPAPVIADVLPSAYVKRLPDGEGFSAAANDALVAVEGSSFHLFLHDDVRLEPGAVTTLVTEAFRSNAGIVGPKLVEWDDPKRLVSVGYSVDPYGFASSISEPGEMDQSQHDTAREVFAVSDACLLIRSDLLRTVGGFSEDIPFFGEDIDLCWRVHVAGATVHFVPSAVVAHRNRFEERRVAENKERLQLRHQARSMLTNYEPFRVLRALPAVGVLSLIDLIGSVVLGRFSRAVDVVAAWLWNLVNLPSLIRARSRVKRFRRAHDSDYLPLMRQGSSRLVSLVRIDEGESRLHSAALAGRGYLREMATGSNRAGITLAVVSALLVVVGLRDLIAGPLPVIREFFDPGDSAGRLLSEWWTGWRDAGLGEPGVPPVVVPGLGILGTILLGSLGLARRLLILAPVLIGALGAWKLFVHEGSTRARAAALTAYGLNPVVLNAVAEGRLSALVTYGAAPWVLRRSARSAGVEPFAAPAAERPRALRGMAGTSLLLVLVGSVTLLGAVLLVVVLCVASIAALLSANRGAAGRMVLHALGAAVLALPVSLPWIVSGVLHGDGSTFTGLWQGRGASPSAADLITGNVGPVTVGLFGWGFVVAAGYALVAGRHWRFSWAAAGWILSALSWLAATALAQADLLAGAGAELLLVPAVLGLAVSIAMGALAFEHDVVGSDFGVSQLLSGVALVALLVTLVPVGVASAEGRWYQPEGDFRRLLRVVDEGDDFRTLWIGDPDLLPLAGWSLEDVPGVSVALSSGLDPTVTERYRLDGGTGVDVLTEAVSAALAGETTRLGRLLGPMGVRYVIAIDRSAPQPFAERETPLPEQALASLREQIDLSEIEFNPAMALFDVTDPWPLRHGFGDTVPDPGDLSAQLQLQVEPPEPVLRAGLGPVTRVTSSLSTEGPIGQSLNADPGWSLTVDGEQADQEEQLGWAQRFTGTGPGDAELAWNPPWWVRVLQGVQLAGFVGLVLAGSRRRRLVAPGRRRGRGHSEAPIVVVGRGEEDAP